MIENVEVVIDRLLMIERPFIIANNSDVTKQEVFEHEFQVSPPAIFDSNGILRLADDKANLTDYIAQNVQRLSSSKDNNVLQIGKTVIDMDSILQVKTMMISLKTILNLSGIIHTVSQSLMAMVIIILQQSM